MGNQQLFEKLAHKVRDKTVFISDHSLRYQRGLGHRSKAPVRQVDTWTFQRNQELNQFYTFNIYYCSRYCSKLYVKARTTKEWTVRRLCAQNQIAFSLITPKAFVISMIAYKQRVKYLLFLINQLPFVQPFQILGLERLYEVCRAKKKCLPIKKLYKTVLLENTFFKRYTLICTYNFEKRMNQSKVITKSSSCYATAFVKVHASIKSTYGEGIIKKKPELCSTFAEPNNNLLNRCKNTVFEYRILTLRLSAIFCQERKKHKIVRPLLDFKRESITMVCKDLQIPVYPDKSNRSVRYSRNRIRKQIIPSIKYFINPQVENSLFKVAQLLQKEQFFVCSLLKNTSVNVHL